MGTVAISRPETVELRVDHSVAEGQQSSAGRQRQPSVAGVVEFADVATKEAACIKVEGIMVTRKMA